MNEAAGETPGGDETVFGVPLLALVRSFRSDPLAAKAFLAAEGYLLAVERLKTDPGVTLEEAAALKAGIHGTAGDPGHAPHPG